MSSVEQDHNAGELDASEEISGELVVARGDGTKVLEFVEEALDQVALAIEREITAARHLAVDLGRNHRRDVASLERFDEGVSVESLVAKQRPWLDIFQQRLRTSQIVRLTGREHHLDRVAKRIDQNVDFGRQSAARAADRLLAVFLGAPALCWCARTMVASSIMYSLSWSLANSLKTRSKTPLFAHRLKRW